MSAAWSYFDHAFDEPAEKEHATHPPVAESDDPQFARERRLPFIEPLDRDDAGKIDASKEDPWDVFIPDEDDLDPLPEPGDFWIEPDE